MSGRKTVCRGLAWVAVFTALTMAAQTHDGRRPVAIEADGYGRIINGEGGTIIDENSVRTARESMSHSTGTPEWTNPPGFEKDVFTFARVIFKSTATAAMERGFGRQLGWWVDFPDADLNFSYRLQQMTSARADPDGRVLKLSDPSLSDYPFIFMEHPGYMRLQENEARALRKYLLAGGSLVVIDFWNSEEWGGFARQMKRVMPEKEWVDLDLDHPVFHCVFDLKGPMQELQVPTKQFWNDKHDPRDPTSNLQTMWRGDGAEAMRVRALLDDKDRVMVIAIHNSDVSDGWEREGEELAYFQRFSEKVSYPLGINLIFYLMTH
jgi:hypothetical protein